MEMILVQSLTQQIRLQQIIEFSQLMKFPDEVMSHVATAINFNPDGIESKLSNLRANKKKILQTKK